jgi:hypothetical protein
MRASAQKVKAFLDKSHVKDETIHHSADFTAQQTAAHVRRSPVDNLQEAA